MRDGQNLLEWAAADTLAAEEYAAGDTDVPALAIPNGLDAVTGK